LRGTKKLVESEKLKTFKKTETSKRTHALDSNETFWTPSEVNISSDPPPKNPALLRRTMPLASVTLPPLF